MSAEKESTIEQAETAVLEEANLAVSEELHKAGSSEKEKREYSGKYKNFQPLERIAPLMTDDMYIKERLDGQIDWYDRKSQFNQHKYKRLKRVEFIIAAVVPVVTTLSAMIKDDYVETAMQIGAALGGIVLVVINKLLELDEHHRLWKEYRGTCEALQYERALYMTRTEPYDERDAYPMFVSKIEYILNKQTQKWVYNQKQPQEERKDPQVVLPAKIR